jgi:hypothetical protein
MASAGDLWSLEKRVGVNRVNDDWFYVKRTRTPHKNLLRKATNLIIDLEMIRAYKWKWNVNI